MSNGRLQGKNAVISGGAEGVGGAASEIFARQGANVAIIDIQGEAGEARAEATRRNNGNAFFVRADVSSADQVGAAVAEINDYWVGDNSSTSVNVKGFEVDTAICRRLLSG